MKNYMSTEIELTFELFKVKRNGRKGKIQLSDRIRVIDAVQDDRLRD